MKSEAAHVNPNGKDQYHYNKKNRKVSNIAHLLDGAIG